MKAVEFIRLKKVVVCLLSALLLFPQLAFSQRKVKEKTLYGIGVFHNFQTEGIGIDLRAKIPVRPKLYALPHFTYFPAMNKIHEYYLGIDAHYHVLQYRKMQPYLLLGAYYDNWINHYDYANNKVKKNNFVVQGGAGVVFNMNCLKPFIEYRYDTKWKEGLLGIGLYFSFGECFAKSRKSKCPAYY